MQIDTKDTIRFWRYVRQETYSSCWDWTGQVSAAGYARFSFNGRTVPAYRFAYELLVGPAPEGLEPDHLCLNRTCVYPWHLDWVTHSENVRRVRRARPEMTQMSYPMSLADASAVS